MTLQQSMNASLARLRALGAARPAPAAPPAPPPRPPPRRPANLTDHLGV